MESLSVNSLDEAVKVIMESYKSLPSRPGIDDIEAAKDLIKNVDKEQQSKLDEIARKTKSSDVPEELFMVLQEMQRNWTIFQSKEQKREALKLIEIENVHSLFDEFIQRASNCVPSSSSGPYSALTVSTSRLLATSPSPSPSIYGGVGTSTVSSSSNFHLSGKQNSEKSELFTRDDSYVKKGKSVLHFDEFGAGRTGISSIREIQDPSLRTAITSGQEGEKLSLIKLASLIEVLVKKGTRDLNLRSKLMTQIDWLPDSIGKLSSLKTLDLSDNKIKALPPTIGGLSSLTKLDLSSNGISEIPNSIGDLLSLVYLNLRGNNLVSLPSTISRLVRLEELDISMNKISVVPESIGDLVSLKKWDLGHNMIEEIPHSIGRCSSLKELLADYNHIKALPEAVGTIKSLEILSVRYNYVTRLPTTVSSLSSLKQLVVSFNALESVPESLCFATTLVKLNISNNFASLQSIPRSVGNLEWLEELDISNNQIRFLPESFRMLSRLRILHVDQNPLEVPPRDIAEKGAQAVVQYMSDHVEKREANQQEAKKNNSWGPRWCCARSNKRKR